MAINQDEINGILWRACDTFRGTIDPSEYKNYILVMLFVKYISDLWIDHRAALIAQYGGDAARAERQLQYERFVLPKGSDFNTLYEQRNAPNLGEVINRALEAIEAANKGKLNDVFRNIDFNSEANLGQAAQRNEQLRNLLADLHDERLDLRPSVVGDLDVIGNAYEYLIGRFASGAGKKAGEFYTPPEVSALLAELLDPQPGERICDPACGSGSLLIQHARRVKRLGSDDYSLWGQEVNGQTWALCMMNMFLHNVNQPTIKWDDTLKSPQLLDPDGQLMRFNVIVSFPPFSASWDAENASADSFQRFHRGIPPKSKGDYAFISHMIETMLTGESENGRVGVIVPHGVLFRGGAEGTIRERLIRENLLDAVIGLPPNLFFGTGIPAAILIFKRHKADNTVLFIDASRLYKEERGQNRLTSDGIERIGQAYRERRSITNLAHLAGFSEIQESQFNLNIARYVFAYEVPEARAGATDCQGEHDVFVSYSRSDSSDMETISGDLINAGFRVWTDSYLEPGTADWQRAIENAIENSCAVVVLMSPDSKQSQWVKKEITYASCHGKRIFPILIRGDQQSAVPIALIDAQYTDLRDQRENNFMKLADSLRIHLNYREYRSPFIYDFADICVRHGWSQLSLGDIAVVKQGGIRRQEFAENDGKYPVYRHTKVIGWSNDFEFDGDYLLVDFLRVGSIVQRVNGRLSATPETFVLQARDGVNADFLYLTLRVIDLPAFGNRLAQGSTRQRLSLDAAVSLQVPCPSIDEQLEIVSIINEQLSAIELWTQRFQKQLYILEQRPAAIIQRAFNAPRAAVEQ